MKIYVLNSDGDVKHETKYQSAREEYLWNDTARNSAQPQGSLHNIHTFNIVNHYHIISIKT